METGKKFIALMLAFCFFWQLPIRCSAEEIKEPGNLYALSACLMDADSGRILFEKNGQEMRANASTTKVLTLILTLERADLQDVVTFSDYAAKQPDVQLNAQAGEQFQLEDLCYSLMLESHNDTAVAIAEHVAGSVEEFARLMNEKASEIGCENSHFVTPNGLDGEDEGGPHQTTAVDLARILSYCITISPKKDLFLQITQTQNYSFTNREGSRSYSCNNHNAFLQMMDGALTGKTGFTGSAGYCYVGALRREEKTYVVALLGCGWPNNKSYKWSDTKKLMQYGIDYFSRCMLEKQEIPPECMEDVTVSGAKTEALYGLMCVPVIRVKDPDAPDSLLLRADQKIEITYEKESCVSAPVRKGDRVGTISYWVGNECVRRDYLLIGDDIEQIDYAWRLRQIFQCFAL
ncbi:MAG: D-alanyl-D-alanine carboxypeptidase family protein [Roseburia sp.]